MRFLLALAFLPLALPAQAREKFRVDTLAPGVVSIVRTESLGLGGDPNNLVVVGDSDVVVVDAHFSPSSTREVADVIARLTPKPVRWVVNTHWHDDHVTGNAVYRERWPGVRFVAHERMRRDMLEQGVKNRQQFIGTAPGTASFLRGLVAKRRNVQGGPLDGREAAVYGRYATLIERFAAEAPGAAVVAPDTTFTERFVITQGERTIELLHLGAGHTAGDVVVHLPRERIVAAGDLVIHPVPFVGSTSFPGEFATTLDRLAALAPRVIVPGHGPLLRDVAYLRRVSALLVAIREQVAAAVARGETLERARASVNLAPFRAEFAAGDPVRELLFTQYVESSAIPAEYRRIAGGK